MRLIPVLLLLLALAAAAPVQAAPNIQHWQTPQGVRVYLVQAPDLPMLDLRVLWDAGSARDGLYPGLARLTAGMLSEGADGLTAQQLNFAFESLGVIFDTGVSRDYAFADLRTLSDPELLRQALHNFKRVLRAPAFPPRALQRRINNTLLSIRADRESPATVAERALFAALYDQHPYATPVKGTAESLPGIQRATVVDFYRRHYGTRNAILVLVGDISKKQAVFVAATLFSGLPEGVAAPPLPSPAQQDQRSIFIPHPSEQTHVLIGRAVVSRQDPDYFPLYVGNHVLGGGGMVSRLFTELRESRGLSYSVYSYFFPLRVAGPFIANLQTRGEQAEQARALLLENIRAFVETGPGAEELAAAKQNITGGFPLRISDNSRILGYVSMIAFYGLPLDYLDTFNTRVRAVTAGQVRDAFRRRLGSDALLTVLVGRPQPQE